jgi:hypothetical protein
MDVPVADTPVVGEARLVCDLDEARAQYEFDVIHRAYESHQRKRESTESALGVITVLAVTLMAVHFANPTTVLDHVLQAALDCAACLGAAGFMLFRGYEAFNAATFQRDYRGNPAAALRRLSDEMTERRELSQRALRAKRKCAWLSLLIITTVEIAASVARWNGT